MTEGSPLSPAQREAIMKQWADFWWSRLSKPGGPTLDEKTFREGLIGPLAPDTSPTNSPK